MANRTIVKGQIGNALESIAPDHILGVASDIFDEDLQMYQSEINRAGSGICNIPEVNDFLVDIVLKNTDDSDSSDSDSSDGGGIDFSVYDTMIVRCCHEATHGSRTEFQNGIYLGSIGNGINLIWKNYDTLAEAKEDLGVLLENDYCYVVLRDIGTYNETVSGTLTFNRDISWKSLNEHPIIKSLLVEQEIVSDSTKEDVANKVTEFSSTPTDVHYPSEKLVYNELKIPLDATVEITESRPNTNVFVLSEVGIVEGHIIRSTGAIVDGGFMTGLIPVKPNTYYYLSNRPTVTIETIDKACIRCVASDGETPIKVKSSQGKEYRNYFLPSASGSQILLNGPLLIPAGAAYLQMNITTPDAESYTEAETQIMLEEMGDSYNPAFVPSSYVEGGSSIAGGYKIKNSAIDFDENITPDSKKPVNGGTVYEAIVRLIEEKSDTKPIRILDLGNSYTGDATHYLKNLLDAAKITTGFSLYCVYRSGASFRNWVNMYKEQDTGANYTLRKVAGDTISDISGGLGTDREWFVNLLIQDWDIILIHQASTYSARYDDWTGDGEAGGLTEYLRILHTYCPKAAIGFYLIHSYASWARKSNDPSQYAYAQGAYTSPERWQNIAKAVQRLNADYNIDFVIPYGTAVQNLRMTSLNGTDPVDSTKLNDFSYDAQHMSNGIGDYVAACAYFEALFAPLFNVTILGNSYTNTEVPVPSPGDDDYYQGRGVPVQITAANALLAQKAAILAVNDMFHLNDPSTVNFIPENSDTCTAFEGTSVPGDLSWIKQKNRPVGELGSITQAEFEAIFNDW